MNTSDHFTVDPDGSTSPGTPGPGASSQGGFFGWIRSLRIVRGEDRWFAGVAAGIAHRLNIDPLIVRGIFIVLAILSAPALTLYLVGWMFLPDNQNRLHAEDVLRGRASSGITVAVVIIAVWFALRLLGPAFAGIGFLTFPGTWDLWSALGVPEWISVMATVMFWIGLLVAGGFAIHYAIVHHGKQQRAKADPNQQHASTDQQPQFVNDTTQNVPDWSEQISNKATEWGDKASEWGENVSQQAEAWSVKYAATHEARSATVATKMLIIGAAIIHTFNYDRDFYIPVEDVIAAEGARTKLLNGGAAS